MPFAATWVGLETIMLSEVSLPKRRVMYHTCAESKTRHRRTCLWNRNRLTNRENELVAAKEEAGWGSDGLGVWD